MLPALWLGIGVGVATADSDTDAAVFRDNIRPLLVDYCFDCHDGDSSKGGVNLAPFHDLASLHRNPKLWENALRQIEDRSMPPRNKRQPEPEQYHQLIDWLKEILSNPTPDILPRDPGQKRIHRLSREEYNLTVRDLLGVTLRPADKFPPDGGGGGGFDNNADTLFVPPVLMERYLEAAEDVLAEAKPERLFFQRPSARVPELEAARNNLTRFAGRAFRRPARDEELDRLLGLFQSAREEEGVDFETAMKITYKAVLVSPSFLFRIEIDPAGQGPHRINDFELASRLSYFLWSSMPDDTLLELAREGQLSEDAVLVGEVRRMLKDSKARAFTSSFIGQWLGTRKLPETASPDARRFPQYDGELRDAMMEEPVRFFEHIVRWNRPVLDLIDSEYTFVNSKLAALYELPRVESDELVWVSLPDRRRGGVTGMAAVLTQTSYPRRTSPVLRGKWVLEELLGTPAPPPPPIVATLPQDDRIRDNLTLRQRLEKHRENANCATCHSRLDPIGFALENFNAVGAWRTHIDTEPVDASGILPDGNEVSGPESLKDALLERRDLFVRQMTEKLLAYALGRGLEFYDIPTVKQIVHALENGDMGTRTMIEEIVRSHPFQYRRGSDVPLALQDL